MRLFIGPTSVLAVMLVAQATPATIITKWQDGKDAALAITFDDSTINQFRIAVPLMNERGLPGTFFVITSQIPGSRHMPTFVGRLIAEILVTAGIACYPPARRASRIDPSKELR